MDLELGVFFFWWLSFHGENARPMDKPRKRWTNAWIIPTAPSWPAPGGPTSLGGHVSTFGMASPAASSPVSAEVQHCALPMVAPRFGSRQQHHGSEPGLCENLIFGWGKGGNPPAVGDVWGRGVSEMILETPQNILGFLIVFSSHWSLVWLCCPHPALKMKCPRGHFFSRNAPQNLTQKQSIKERQTDFCQTYQRYCLVTFKSFSSSTDCGPNG